MDSGLKMDGGGLVKSQLVDPGFWQEGRQGRQGVADETRFVRTRQPRHSSTVWSGCWEDLHTFCVSVSNGLIGLDRLLMTAHRTGSVSSLLREF